MAQKGELPLHIFNRHNERQMPASARRRRVGISSKRQGVGISRSLWFATFCSLGCVAFLSGILIGMELTRTPSNSPTPSQGKQPSPLVPRLKHPSGWDMHGESKVKDSHLRFPKPDEDGVMLPPRPGPGGVVSDEGGFSTSKAKGLEGMPWLKDHSFRSSGGSYVSSKDNLDQSEEVSAAAWIFIDRSSTDIKTILGNKMSGCGSDALGFALYVNEWENSDGKLWLEWGSGTYGCEKLSTDKPLPVGQWVHVGFRIAYEKGADHSGEKIVSLFVDGYDVASRKGDWRPGSREEFAIGAFSNSEFPFDGRISAVTMYSSALKDDQFADLTKQSGTQRLGEALGSASLSSSSEHLLVALQLDEAVEKQKDGLVAKHDRQEAKGEAGTYHFLHLYDVPEVDNNLKDGIGTGEVTEEMRRKSDEKGRQRAEEVKEAMRHAWKGYEDFAFGDDELLPRSRRGKNNWGGMGVTLVDSLDTLWLMDMKDEFWRARDWVRDHLSFGRAGEVSVFETTIRELGGLLAAYDLSGDEVFVKKAKELGDHLLPAFNTASGIPTSSVNFKSGRNSGSRSVLAELGTLQVEFRYLSEVTGDPKYADKVNHVYDLMSKLNPSNGLFPIFISHSNGKPVTSQVTFGALGDSFYEYLLKVWIQGGQKEDSYRLMYDKAMDGMTNILLKKSDPNGLTYVSDWNGQSNNHKMDHLVCFLAGTLALGAETTTDPMRKERDMKTAKALGYTCYQMYKRQKTGLAPEYVNFRPGKDMVVERNAAYNILRPETAEALFVLHQLTGDPIYRDWSYELFQAFEKHCRLPVAYGSFHNVNNPAEPPEDRMESFFLAETLKYLYLIQDPDHGIDLSKYVFNTEAHPLRIFSEL